MEKEAFVKKVVGFAKGKVAVVLDVGGRGDLSFNDMGFKGTDLAAKDFGYDMVEIQCATAADYLPNMRNVARTGDYDLIICVGFLLGDALATAATEFPEQKFAIIDVGYITGPNIMNIVFRENEQSALVGALGAMVAAEYGYKYVGVVLGIEIPVLYHFEAGYRFGIEPGRSTTSRWARQPVRPCCPRARLLSTTLPVHWESATWKRLPSSMTTQERYSVLRISLVWMRTRTTLVTGCTHLLVG